MMINETKNTMQMNPNFSMNNQYNPQQFESSNQFSKGTGNSKFMQSNFKQIDLSGMDKISIGKDSTSQYQVPIQMSMNQAFQVQGQKGNAQFKPNDQVNSVQGSEMKMHATQNVYGGGNNE
jgi:hypothetical protein